MLNINMVNKYMLNMTMNNEHEQITLSEDNPGSRPTGEHVEHKDAERERD